MWSKWRIFSNFKSLVLTKIYFKSTIVAEKINDSFVQAKWSTGCALSTAKYCLALSNQYYIKMENGKNVFTGYSCCMSDSCNTYDNMIKQITNDKVFHLFLSETVREKRPQRKKSTYSLFF